MDMPSSSYHSTYRGSSRTTTTTTSYTPSTALTSRAYPYPSPGSALNQSEDPVVIEIGTRYLRAGFANEPAPRCEILYTEDLWRRVGDKVVDSGKKGGTMLPQRTSAVLDTTAQSKKKSTRKSRGELWQHDLRSLDTGLVEDLLERALREAYNKYLLIDSKTKKVFLPLPPLLPTALIKAITNTIFKQFYPPTITYFSAPVLCTVSAGLRSALVVDIGWHETVVTPIYELRVIGGLVGAAGRTKRAGKLLRKKTEEILEKMLLEKGIEGKRLRESYVEELVQRVIWCETYEVHKRERELYQKTGRSVPPGPTPVSPVAVRTQSSSSTLSTAGSATMLIPLQTIDSPKPLSINVPLSMLSLPVEHTFFTPVESESEPDQDELSLPELVYKTLLTCHIDVRAVCLSRIVIVGGPSNIPGLKGRLIDELCSLVEEKGGWNIVTTAKAARSKRKKVSTPMTVEEGDEPPPPPLSKYDVKPLTPPIPPRCSPVEFLSQTPTESSSHEFPQVSQDRESPTQESLPQESPPQEFPPQQSLTQESLSPENCLADPEAPTGDLQEQWLASLDRTRRYQELDARQNPKPSLPPGLIRGVKSLGAWVGGSIVAGARVRGICEVEREKFLATVASGGVGLPSTML